MEEIWVDIPDYPNYLISNLGNVYSIRRERLLKLSIGTQGYLQANLERDDRWRTQIVHTMVAHAFVPGYFDGAVVKHKDGDNSNNVYTNLEWAVRGTTGRRSANPRRRWQIIDDEQVEVHGG